MRSLDYAIVAKFFGDGNHKSVTVRDIGMGDGGGNDFSVFFLGNYLWSYGAGTTGESDIVCGNVVRFDTEGNFIRCHDAREISYEDLLTSPDSPEGYSDLLHLFSRYVDGGNNADGDAFFDARVNLGNKRLAVVGVSPSFKDPRNECSPLSAAEYDDALVLGMMKARDVFNSLCGKGNVRPNLIYDGLSELVGDDARLMEMATQP